jgi:hypothetical protein
MIFLRWNYHDINFGDCACVHIKNSRLGLLLRILLRFRGELALLAGCDDGLLCNLVLKILHLLVDFFELDIILLVCSGLSLDEVL